MESATPDPNRNPQSVDPNFDPSGVTSQVASPGSMTPMPKVPPTNDLSHIFANPDLNQAQEHHEKLPKEARKHFINVIAHKAGLRADPGRYKGPPITVPAVPSDQDTRDLMVGMKEQQSQAALEKQSTGGPSAPPLPPYSTPRQAKKAAKMPLGQGAPPTSPTGMPPMPNLNPQLGGLAPMPSPASAGSGDTSSTS